jgi:hypothetical protein
MNLDDLMEVWRSQDAAPVHGVNETLLRLALRQDEAKLQAQRRRERWIACLTSALFIAFTVFVLFVMIYPYDDDVLTGWDYAIPIVGVATALLWGRAMYVSHQAQALREKSFGESLRDQLGRHIARLDYQATRLRWGNVLVTALLPVVGSTTMILGTLRINEKRPSDEWVLIVGMIFVGVTSVAASFSEKRRRVQRDLLPRQRRLEALRKELDG